MQRKKYYSYVINNVKLSKDITFILKARWNGKSNNDNNDRYHQIDNP